jgi:hypothetical protein
MQVAPHADAPDQVLTDLVARIGAISDPDRLEELVVLALQMTHRRTEEAAERDSLVDMVHVMVAAVRAESQADARMEALHRVGKDCIALIEAANARRARREIVYLPEARAASPLASPDSDKNKAHPASGGWTWPALSSLAALCIVCIGAVAMLASGSLPKPAPEAPQTATYIAALIEDAAADPAWGSDRTRGPLTLHVLRRSDQSSMTLAEGIPQRKCLEVATLLSAKGDLSINGVDIDRQVRAAFAAACRNKPGSASIAWTRRRSAL